MFNDFKQLEEKVGAQIGELKEYMDGCFNNILNHIKLLRSQTSKEDIVGEEKVL